MTTSQYIFIKTSLDWHGQDTDKRTSLLCGQDDFNRGGRGAPNVSLPRAPRPLGTALIIAQQIMSTKFT